jgi:hypothetical protein
MLISPYTPSAGRPPIFLAGRDDKIEDATKAILHLIHGNSKQPIVYYGLRGVGKTVLLTKIEDIAKEYDILFDHIEATEVKDFKKDFAISINKQINSLSKIELAKSTIKKAVGALKAFTMKWSQEGEVSFGFDVESLAYIAGTGDYKNDFTASLVALGEILNDNAKHLCFFVDEIQYLKKDELNALSMGLHKINQLRLPIYFIGAALPKIVRSAADAKSYTERLFNFVEIGSLDYKYTESALCEPAKKYDVVYTKEAIEMIFEITSGYPYFIQEFGECVWDYVGDNKTIDVDSVEIAHPIFLGKLDESFFKSRYDKATPLEKNFMFSMARCTELPCTTNNVAEHLKRATNSISTYRMNLINKGLIYQTDHGKLDFTVPLFSEYLKRINPSLEFVK